MGLDFAAEVDKQMEFLRVVRAEVFPFITADFVNPVHEVDDDRHYIEFGPYNFYPVEGVISSIAGDRPCIHWSMMVWATQHNYPFAPDDVDEEEIGEFDSIFDCLCEIGRQQYANQIGAIQECLALKAGEEELNKAAEEWEEMQKEDKSPCPHQNDPGECNACMIASDLAYDAAREDRHFGRRSL